MSSYIEWQYLPSFLISPFLCSFFTGLFLQILFVSSMTTHDDIIIFRTCVFLKKYKKNPLSYIVFYARSFVFPFARALIDKWSCTRWVINVYVNANLYWLIRKYCQDAAYLLKQDKWEDIYGRRVV